MYAILRLFGPALRKGDLFENMSSKRRPKHYKPLRVSDCKPKKTRMELLFDKIRQQEQERRSEAIIAQVNTEEPQMQAPGDRKSVV